MKLYIAFLSIFLIVATASLTFGKNGVMELIEVQKEIAIQKDTNKGLELRNQEMFAEIHDLEQGLNAIEERARNELGMIKEGETFYRITSDSSLLDN